MNSLLAGYASSSSDDAGPPKRRNVSQPPAPKPKAKARPTKPPAARLPSLPTSFTSTPDDPSAHQGRRRARPFTDGDYYAHIYAELPVPPALARALTAVIGDLRTRLPDYAVHPILDGPQAALHVSLSHPLPLRRGLTTSLAPELASAVAKLKLGKLRLSLASLAGYTNTAGRAFVALCVGAGASELARALEHAVAPVLRRHHLPAYHDDAEFHASFAWCLQAGAEGDKEEREGDVSPSDAAPFTPELLAHLGATRSAALLKAQPASGWTITDLCVKVARDVTRIPL
ncbi:U6 snRNA phosphodiesterase [Vanrija pseudolonga]|uniref:U6 snRNA phosphodiesterase 1 n=1 Tax=Vanrija pseudolonga TaxID=143232 RepID=A0AAF0YJJ5_9TREE|nr:U6 snRNA phosphodiesterase [Vanrija pseudolonga]